MPCPLVPHKINHRGIAAGLALAVFLWGANNTGVKFLVRFWPPIAIGSSRFLAAGPSYAGSCPDGALLAREKAAPDRFGEYACAGAVTCVWPFILRRSIGR